jgi:hypothetical protein
LHTTKECQDQLLLDNTRREAEAKQTKNLLQQKDQEIKALKVRIVPDSLQLEFIFLKDQIESTQHQESQLDQKEEITKLKVHSFAHCI